jgi:hypothetical protein
MLIGPRVAFGEQYYLASHRAGVRTPRLYDAGPALSLSPAMTREQVHEMVEAWRRHRPDFGKLPSYNDSIKQQYQWTMEELHQAGFAAIGHSEDCLGAVRAGLDVIEHLWGCAKSIMTPQQLDGFLKGEYLHWALFFRDQARTDALIKEAIQRGAYLNPTLLYEFSSQTPQAQQFETDSFNVYRNDALMTYYPHNLADGLMAKFRIARSYSTKYGTMVRVAHLTDKERQESREAYRLAGAVVKRWVELGGKIAGGSDTPSIGTAGLALHLEMAMLVESGLTPMQALQSETLWGAEMLTARRNPAARPEIGVIGAGSYADLVVLGANPLDSIQNTRRIERVMKGGQFVTLGYTADYASSPAAMVRSTPYVMDPEISAITPHSVTEGSPEFELTVEGEGFLPDSVVKLDGAAVPTTFVNIRTLKAKIPASFVAQAVPDRFMLSTNPVQATGVYGDRTVKVTVFTGPPDGGTSNSVSLQVMAKWMAERK